MRVTSPTSLLSFATSPHGVPAPHVGLRPAAARPIGGKPLIARRLSMLFVTTALLLLPALAWAGAGGTGDDAGQFGDILKTHGALVAILAAFVFGLAASLTPCVYPMVPITVSIFGATDAKSRLRGAALSATFVAGIAALFVPMGVAFALSGKMMGSALSNAFVVCGLALLFLALAASMFGAFELALPSGLTNRLSTVGGVGFKGAFAMGVVMGLVAAPCTGPFLTGILVVIASSRDVLLGSAALLAFSLGLGVLFFVTGAFAVNLPKAGAWMMGIKWAGGVTFAYMAFAYLRDRFEPIRDLVAHPGTAFGVVSGLVLLVGLALGLTHVLAERRNSPIAHLSKTTKLASIVPAVAGAAMFVSWLPQNHGGAAAENAPEIVWLADENEGRAKALAEGKPVLLDFGAEWCTACKELEHKTFPDPLVRTEAARFVAIRVDATDDEAPDTKRLTEKYKIVGLPTVILLDKDGSEVTRFNEFVTADRFAAALKKVPEGASVGMK